MDNKNEHIIKRFKDVHGDKYDYFLVEYKNSKTKVKIICSVHGVFEQLPTNHLKGGNCKKCSILEQSKKITNTNHTFIERAKIVHHNKYDYSSVAYKKNNLKVNIICPKHGSFEQTPASHLRGSGCHICSNVFRPNNQVFIEKSKNIHNEKYDYSYVVCKNNYTHVKIKCPKHGIFKQSPYSHLRGNGCKKCAIELTSLRKTKNTEDFIKKAKQIHGNNYGYDFSNYVNAKTKVKIICKKHGEFTQIPSMHLQGRGCPMCKISKGEKDIINLMKKHNIKFSSHHTFDRCKNKRKLSYDFYINKFKTCIEFHGRQHFESNAFLGGIETFEKQKINDSLKEKFCMDENISLILIFKERKYDKFYTFVDLYENSDSKLINILLDDRMKKINKEQYVQFKKNFK